MPVRAIIDGAECIAPFLSDEEWSALRDRVKLKTAKIQMPCCGVVGHLRESKNGIRHFYHARAADCTTKPETEEHLLGKREILLACRDEGWDAQPEAERNGWRADVLATRGGVTIALEVQWSSQTEAETRERQSRYEADGVRCFWFFRKPPAELEPQKGVPAFKLLYDAAARRLCVSHLDRNHHLRDFARALLASRVCFCDQISLAASQLVRVAFYEVCCWKCKAVGHDYRVEDSFKTACGIDGGHVDERVTGSELQFEPQIVSAVQEYLGTDAARGLNMGAIKQRYSRARNGRYLSVGCAGCDALFGDHFKGENIAEAEYSRTAPPISFEFEITCHNRRSVLYPHWCFPMNGRFCDGRTFAE